MRENTVKPNIIMIMADQMVADVIGALGHTTVLTPNLDKLVRNGIAFTNAYCNSPLCVPSRASMMSGQLPNRIGVYDNGSEFAASIPTFVHHLRKNGYETVLSGKMHFIGPDQLHGFEERLTKDIHTAAFDLTPDWTKGVYANHGTGIKRLQNPGECDWNSQLLNDEKAHFRTLEKIRAIGRNPARRPFFLCTSYMHPHDPFVMTKEYWDRYEGVDIPLPEVSAEPVKGKHPYNRWIQIHHEVDQLELTEEQIRGNRRAYYAMVSYVDDKVGEIIRELKRFKLLDNTLIVFTSDHGEMLGEHGMWFKRTFYDPAAKVPLIFSWADKEQRARKVEQVVSLVDLGATLMHIAQVPDAEEWIALTDGNSFHMLLREGNCNWKDEAIIEYSGEGPIHPMVALRQGNFKYVHVHEESSLLYDLEKDPHELRNVMDEPEYAEIAAKLRLRLQENYDMAKLEADILLSQKQRRMLVDSLSTGVRTRWDHVPSTV